MFILLERFACLLNATVAFAIYFSSSYINVLPFVLVFGIATSLTALHRALPYHVSSKVNIQVFSSQPSTTYLNSVVEHVFFSEDFPFRLGKKVFNLFTDVFLFYDLSVTGFIKNYKVSRCVGNKVWYLDYLRLNDDAVGKKTIFIVCANSTLC